MALGDPARGIESTSFEIDHSSVPLLPGAREAAGAGFLPGGLKNNRDFIGDCVGFADGVPQQYRDLLFDPQTSGGLLISISPESADAALSALVRHGVSARRIGRVLAKRHPLLLVH
jgi:selenide,water dikinase